MQRPWRIAAGIAGAAVLAFTLVQADGRGAVAAAGTASATPGATISVTGSGSAHAVPDTASVTLGVTVQSANAASAMQQDGQRLTAVVAALRQAGVAAQDIRTSSLSLNPQYQSGPGGGSGRITGFTADNTVTATVRQTGQLGTVIDAALGAGANAINGVQFVAGDPSAAQAEAYAAAVADAQSSARAIAAAAGLRITGIQSITANQTCCVGPVFAAAAAPSAAPVPVFAGQQTVQESVQVVFAVTP